jgi:two-component system, OmpR family, sensor kinase
MSFRRRLIIVTSTMTLGTLAFSLASVYFGVNRVQERILDRELLEAAHDEAESESRMPEEQLRITSAPGPFANSAAPLPKYGVLFDPAGGVHGTTPTVGQTMTGALVASHRHTLLRPFDSSLGKINVRAVVVPVPAHEGWQLLFALPKADVERDDWLIGGSMLVVFVLALVASVTVIVVVMARLTRSHMAIASTALRVSEGDLSARVGIREGDEEIVGLSTNIDHMVERLQRLMEAQHNFIAHAAHELRSPLTTIHGSLALALRQPRGADEYRRMIEDALESTKHLNHLAEDLLLLARIQAGDEETEPVVLAEPVYEAVESVRGAADARNVRVEVHAQPTCVDGRPRDLERMIRNLVENAVRHSPEGASVRVDMMSKNDKVRISVEDEGPGVAPASREVIFQPFTRGESTHVEGAGLGLAIAREIARRHGGDIWVEAASKGARFVSELPLRTSVD